MKSKFTTFAKTKKQNYFKAVSLMAIFVFVASFVVYPFIIKVRDGLQANTSWFTSYASSYASGTGISTNPYIIKTPQQLALFAYHVKNRANTTSHFKLGNYINLEGKTWTPIGDTLSFNGTFDGDGHAILNMVVNTTSSHAGLFASLSNATVRNVYLINGSVSGSSDYSGALVGHSSNSRIEKVYSNISVSNSSSGSIVGGIIGQATNTNVSVVANHGAVSAGNTSSVGGVAGSFAGNLTTAYNHGSVTGSGNVGGLVGSFGNTASANYTIDNSYNAGTITSYSNSNVGGIAGNVNSNNGNTIKNSFNDGNITSTVGNNVGGIAGNATRLTVTKVYNLKNVTSNGKRVAGIVGNANAGTQVTEASNSGNITGFDNVGGIVGFAENSGKIESSFNSGTVRANSTTDLLTGGILGHLNFSSGTTYTLTKNGNTGNIRIGTSISNPTTLSGAHIAGILGFAYNNSSSRPTLNITENFNAGTIEGYNRVGGIVGAIGRNLIESSDKNVPPTIYRTSVYIERNSNVGQTRGFQLIGGIIGNFEAETESDISFTYNYGAGTFSRMGTSLAQLVGTFVGNNIVSSYTWNRADRNYFYVPTLYGPFPVGMYNSENGVSGAGLNFQNNVSGVGGYIRSSPYSIYLLGNAAINGYLGPILSPTFMYVDDLVDFISQEYRKYIPSGARYKAVTAALNSSIYGFDKNTINNGKPYIKNMYW